MATNEAKQERNKPNEPNRTDDGRRIKEMKSIWFTPFTGGVIGIVQTDSGRFYIGTGKGLDEEADAQAIAEFGSPFNLDDICKYFGHKQS